MNLYRVCVVLSDFEARVNEIFKSGAKLHDGYAPFCKHLFISNFAGLKSAIVRITPDNEDLLRSTYEARTEKELPVLVRGWVSEVGEFEGLRLHAYCAVPIR